MTVVSNLSTNDGISLLRSLTPRQNFLTWLGRMSLVAWSSKMKERQLRSYLRASTHQRTKLERLKLLSEWMKEILIVTWSGIICEMPVKLDIQAPSKSTLKLKKVEFHASSGTKLPPTTTWNQLPKLRRNCTQDSIRSVASEDPSSQVDRSRELPLHVPSSRTQRSSS